VASDFVRQISSPFTTRLVLVFASWADENIIRIETVQDAFVASSQRIFFPFNFERVSQQVLKVLKVPKVPRSAFKYAYGSMGTEQWPHLTARLFGEAVPLIRDIFPSMFKRNLRQEKYVENISNLARTRADTCLGCTSSEHTSIRSDSHIGAAWPGRGSRQGSRPLRGAQDAALTQAFPPGPFLCHVGNVQVWPRRDAKIPRPRSR